MQVKKLAVLLAAASLATAMLTGCPWDEEDKTDDAASSTPGSSSSSSQPGGGEDDDKEDDKPAVTYTITTSVDGVGGTISVSETDVTAGGAITVTINPGSGYAIDSVTDNGTDVTTSVTNDNTYTIQNVAANHAIIVTFKSTIDPKDPTTWKTTGTAPNKTIIAPAEITLTSSLASRMLAVDGVNSVDLSQSGITSIPDGTFMNSNLVSITVPDDTAIGKDAFSNCTFLGTVHGTLGNVDKSAFLGCSNLTSVTVNGSVGQYAFYNCDALKTVDGTLGNVDKYAFYSCDALKTVGGTLGDVDGYAFQHCTALTSAWVNGEVGSKAFYACSNLQHLRVGEEFEITGDWSFLEVANLTVYYTGEMDTDFEASIRSQLEDAGAISVEGVKNCTDEEWAAIISQAGNGKLAQFLLGL